MNPNAISDLRDVRSRGANTGDIRDFGGAKWRWDGTQWTAEGGGGQSQSQGQPKTAAQVASSLADEIRSAFDVYSKRGEQFDAANPFSFDEVQAKASAEERYNPYYSAELSDFVKGVELRRQSKEGERGLLTELNRVQAGAERRALDEAVKQSEEGFAGAGLFFSGAKERGTGMQNIAGAEQAETRDKRFQFGQEKIGRGLTGLANEKRTGERQIGAARTTSIESELGNLKAEESARHATERAQYVGYPGVSMSGGFNELLSGAFRP